MAAAYAWYIVQALSGHEKNVAKEVLDKADREGLADLFEEVTVPVENTVEMKKGKKVSTEKKFFPGYVLVKMRMDERAWHLVRTIPKVTGFLGGKGRPQPISNAEAERIFKQMEEGISDTKHTITFDIGETVRVVDGPFESFVGVVEEIDEDKGTLKVSVSIFGRATPVELEFTQVERV